MPRANRCGGCKLFLGRKGKCPDTAGLKMKACRRFKAGRPLAPRFRGALAKEVKFDPDKPAVWSFWINDRQVMVLGWDVDHNQYGHFRALLLGLDDQGLITKQFTADQQAPAFHGEVAVKGAGENDLWLSFGYEDADEVDHEGNNTNKPREVLLRPRRRD